LPPWSAAAIFFTLRGDRSFMGSAGSLFSTWFFQLPNFVLAALMYTLLGRVLLGLIVDPESPNYIWRFLCRLTDPIVAVFGPATPKAVAPVVLWLFCFVWLFWLRVLLLFLFASFGLLPHLG
jgi:hypothetical protein